MSQNGRLVCLSGPNAGREYELSDEVTGVGRAATSQIVLADSFASRQHGEIYRIDNGYQIRDLSSKNGVYVRGQRLGADGRVWLNDGDEVQFASTRFRFHDPSATVTAPSLLAVREPGLRVEMTTRQVYVDGVALDPPLSVKQFDLLWYLYENRGRAVSKDEIALQVWSESEGDTYDANIDRMVSRVRSRIEPGESEEARFITTVRGYGYQLVLE
ncbi:MAG: winged helix-turn-helix domain-containing protein [Chloroflexi bacterium]|nr:winged helix-turn-helix domain-containing protein [Chloroflexota bacterium]